MSMVRQALSLMTLVLLSLASMSTTAPTINESKSKNRTTLISLSQTDGLGQVGNPSDIAYNAWLEIKDSFGSDGAIDTASQKRRITPKSVFIAPNITSCPDGYYPDNMNRCNKKVAINTNAHLDFLAQRLNMLLGGFDNNQSPSSPSPTGPLQLNIPLLVDSAPEDYSQTGEIHRDEGIVIPLVFPLLSGSEDLDHTTENSNKKDSFTVVHQIPEADGEKGGDSDSKFFLGFEDTKVYNGSHTSTTTKAEQSPIMEFIDETNSTFSDIVNYKIPESEDKINNHTYDDSHRFGMIDEDHEGDTENQKISQSSLSPNVEDSLSQTTEFSKDDYGSSDNLEEGNMKSANWTNAGITEEIIIITPPHNGATFVTPIFVNSSEAVNISSDLDIVFPVSTESTIDELESTDYPDHDRLNVNDEEAEEDSTESDEILAHSEAGLIVTIPPLRVQQSSTPTEVDKEATGSTISSEVSINSDFIRETTLLGMNYDQSTDFPKDPHKIESETHSTPPNYEKIESSEQLKVTLVPAYISLSAHSESKDDDKKRDEKPKIIIQVTKLSDDGMKKQTSLPSIINIDKALSTKVENSNPVTKIEESSEPPTTKGPQIVFPSFISENTPVLVSEKENSEIMEASSTNVAEIVIPRKEYDQVLSYNRKRVGLQHPEVAKIFEMEYFTTTPASDPKTIYDHNLMPITNKYPDRQHYALDDNNPEIKATNDQRFDADHPSHVENNFREHSVISDAKNFVRFPNSEKSENRPHFVRFPTEEANSIHTSDDFKDRQQHHPHSQLEDRIPGKNAATSTFKRPYWSPWRTNRQQKRSRSTRGRKNRSPIHLHEFWTIMPLLGDPISAHDSNYKIGSLSDTKSSRPHVSDQIHFYEDEFLGDRNSKYTNSPPIGG